MEKEDILEISRREHQNRDLAELEASVQAGNLAGRVGAGVCCLVSALFVRAVLTVLYLVMFLLFLVFFIRRLMEAAE